jgi:hypothetical protein
VGVRMDREVGKHGGDRIGQQWQVLSAVHGVQRTGSGRWRQMEHMASPGSGVLLVEGNLAIGSLFDQNLSSRTDIVSSQTYLIRPNRSLTISVWAQV